MIAKQTINRGIPSHCSHLLSEIHFAHTSPAAGLLLSSGFCLQNTCIGKLAGFSTFYTTQKRLHPTSTVGHHTDWITAPLTQLSTSLHFAFLYTTHSYFLSQAGCFPWSWWLGGGLLSVVLFVFENVTHFTIPPAPSWLGTCFANGSSPPPPQWRTAFQPHRTAIYSSATIAVAV